MRTESKNTWQNATDEEIAKYVEENIGEFGDYNVTSAEILERFSLSDDQTRLDFELTVTDASTFTRPAVLMGYWLALGDTIARYDCQPLRN